METMTATEFLNAAVERATAEGAFDAKAEGSANKLDILYCVANLIDEPYRCVFGMVIEPDVARFERLVAKHIGGVPANQHVHRAA